MSQENEQKEVPMMDLTKAVPISAEEEIKLSAFLGRLQQNINGDK